LTPAKLCFLTFSESKHAEHLSHPLGDILNQCYVQRFTARIDIHVRPRNEIAQGINSRWCIKRVAEGFSELNLALVETLKGIV